MGWGQILGSAAGTFFGGPVGGTLGGAAGDAIESGMEQNAANQFNNSSAEANRAFQERMSGTAYQRAMSDMRAAGLNPMLAYSQGGASVPTGSMATYTPVAASVSSAGSQARTTEQQAPVAAATARNLAASTEVADENVRKIRQEVVNLQTDNERAKAVIDLTREQYQNAIKEGFNLVEVGNNLRATFNKLKAETALVNTQQFRTEINAQLDKFELDAAQKFEGSGAAARQIKPILDLIRALFPRVRN